MTTPEERARQKINEQLQQCGWIVQDADAINITSGLGVAIREFPLATGFADYLLYAEAKAIGVVEAKPEGHTLRGVETQSAKYTDGLPDGLPHYHLPLPFAYESTGAITQFTNGLNPDPRSREVFTFHRPEELIRLATLENQLRANLRQLPPLATDGLWDVQIEAIRNLEESLAANRLRALIQMATGSGKTYSMLTVAKRLGEDPVFENPTVLMLVDRNELEAQLFRNLDEAGVDYVEVNSKRELAKLLKADRRGLVISMIHKFDKIDADLVQRDNVFVLVEEVTALIGDTASGPVMSVTDNQLAIDSSLSLDAVPLEKLSAEQRAALKKLQDYERRVAAISFELEEEIFDPVEEQIEKELYAREVK